MDGTILSTGGFAAASSLLFPILFPRVEAIDTTFGQRLSIWAAAIQGFSPILSSGWGLRHIR